MNYNEEDDEDYEENGHSPQEVAATFAGSTLTAVVVAAFGPVIPFIVAAAAIAFTASAALGNAGPDGKK